MELFSVVPQSVMNRLWLMTYGVEHQYMVTEPIDGVPSKLPTLRDPDRLTYYKEEVGGLVMGVGFIVGLRISAVLFCGAVTGWLLLVPLAIWLPFALLLARSPRWSTG